MKRKLQPARQPDAPARVVAYIRVSSKDQAENGFSLEAQQEKVAGYCRLYELDLVATIVDRLSAKNIERPQLLAALAMLERGEADALLVVKLDRLTRSVRDLGEILERWFQPANRSLMSVGEQVDTRTAAGRLVLNVLTSVAEWEREAISERTTAVLQSKKARGERVGSIPWGFRLDEQGPRDKETGRPINLEPDPEEQRIARRIRRSHAAGQGIREIARNLNAEQVPCRGHAWWPMGVQRIVTEGGA